MGPLTELSLFSGAGGGLLASKHLLGWRTVCYVEWNKLAQLILQARIKDRALDDAPIWDTVTTFDGKQWRGLVDVISAGFPCQPYSVAGFRLGPEDERNLWPDTLRIIREVRPEWVVLENVPGLLSFDYVRRIFADLAEEGFDIAWSCLSAFDVGAPHLRERLWIVAHANCGRCGIAPYVAERKRIGGGGMTLTEVLGGKPNPRWSEWLMGWPEGWANNSSPLAMDKFQQWLHLHGKA